MAYQLKPVLQGIYEWKEAEGGQEAVLKLVRLCARDAGKNRRNSRADVPGCPNGRGSLGEDPSPLNSRFDDRFHMVAQRTVLSLEAQGS